MLVMMFSPGRSTCEQRILLSSRGRWSVKAPTEWRISLSFVSEPSSAQAGLFSECFLLSSHSCSPVTVFLYSNSELRVAVRQVHSQITSDSISRYVRDVTPTAKIWLPQQWLTQPNALSQRIWSLNLLLYLTLILHFLWICLAEM